MTSDGTPPTMCARHPDVETGLSCGRCDTPICPRCMVYTPAGARCPDCAAIGRPRMYVMAAADYARAVPTALVLGVALGIAGAMLLSPSARIGLFSIAIAVAGGYGVGIAMGEALNLVTRRKRGREIQVIAGAGVALAWLTRLALFVAAGAPPIVGLADVTGLMLMAIGIAAATSRLR